MDVCLISNIIYMLPRAQRSDGQKLQDVHLDATARRVRVCTVVIVLTPLVLITVVVRLGVCRGILMAVLLVRPTGLFGRKD